MTPEERARLERLERLVAGNTLITDVSEGNVADLEAIGAPAVIGSTVRLVGEQALQYADRRGFSFALGVKLARDEVAFSIGAFNKHLDSHDQGGGETEHSHSQYVLKDALRGAVE